MRGTIIGLAAALCGMGATAGAALAADASPTGAELGIRSGYALPFGDETGAPLGGSSSPLGNSINGVVPIWLDAGYRFTPNVFIGASFQYGIAFMNTGKLPDCQSSGVSCAANDLMVGLEFHYHAMPDQALDPWAGIGVGYEILNYSASAQDSPGESASLNGFQFFNVQLGADYKATPSLGMGPFVMFSLSQFSSCSTNALPMWLSAFDAQHGLVAGPAVVGCTIPQTAMHEWLTFGIRGAYDIKFGH